MGAKLIHRESSTSNGITRVWHVYSNGDVWEFDRDNLTVQAWRRTRGFASRLFPSVACVSLFGWPDGWKV